MESQRFEVGDQIEWVKPDQEAAADRRQTLWHPATVESFDPEDGRVGIDGLPGMGVPGTFVRLREPHPNRRFPKLTAPISPTEVLHLAFPDQGLPGFHLSVEDILTGTTHHFEATFRSSVSGIRFKIDGVAPWGMKDDKPEPDNELTRSWYVENAALVARWVFLITLSLEKALDSWMTDTTHDDGDLSNAYAAAWVEMDQKFRLQIAETLRSSYLLFRLQKLQETLEGQGVNLVFSTPDGQPVEPTIEQIDKIEAQLPQVLAEAKTARERMAPGEEGFKIPVLEGQDDVA